MEQTVNDLLMKARTVAEIQYKRGNKDAGDLVITISSKLAKELIDAYNLNGKIYCGHCGRDIKEASDRDYVRDFGVCLMCDDLYGEMVEEQRLDMLN